MKKLLRLLFVTMLCTATASSFQIQAQVDNTDLFDAIHEKNVENVRAILQSKSVQDLNTPTDYQIDDYVIPGHTPVLFAVESAGYQSSIEPKETPESDAIVGMLIEKGAEFDPDLESGIAWNPLKKAAMQGNTKIVEILLKAGARARQGTALLPTQPLLPHLLPTALSHAYFNGHINVAEVLLKHDPDLVHAKDAKTGQTYLHQIASQAQIPDQNYDKVNEAIKHLIKHGADVNATDNKGHTPDQITSNLAVKKIIQERQQPTASEEQQEAKPSTWLSWFRSLRRPTWHDTQAVKAYVYRKYRCLRSGEGCSRSERLILATLAAAVGLIVVKKGVKMSIKQKARPSKEKNKEEREHDLVVRYRQATESQNRSIFLQTIIDVNINAQNSETGDTALMIAAELKHLDDVKTLLSSKGININIENIPGATALSKALYLGHKKIAKQLIREGANIKDWIRRTVAYTPVIEAIEKELLEEK